MSKKYYFFLPVIYIFLDQLTKFLTVKNIPYYSSIKINDYFSIVNVSNTGAAFSMFQNNNTFFIIFISAVLIYLIYFMIKNKSELTRLQQHCLLFILSGGAGNLIDRIFRGAVVDFIDIGYKDVYRWPSFNVADSCVCIGVGLFLISMIIRKTTDKLNS